MSGEARSDAALGRAEWVFLAVDMLLGAAMRVYWNDVPGSAAGGDETFYRNYTQFLFEEGWAQYPSLVGNHIQSEAFWKSPPPTWICALGIECQSPQGGGSTSPGWICPLGIECQFPRGGGSTSPGWICPLGMVCQSPRARHIQNR